MQKFGAALVQIVAAFVIANATACASTQQVAHKAPVVDEDEALRQKLRDLEAKGPLHFETNTDALDYASRGVLREVKEQLFLHPRTKVIITGHADERGDDAYNLALGERRAQAARDFLLRLGVPAGRIRTISIGEEQPLINGHDESAWAQNRRDEFVFVLPGSMPTLAQQNTVATEGDGALFAHVTLGE